MVDNQISMRTIAILLACVFHQAFAQTYFYIGSIDVEPASPTTADQIEIHIHGDLSSTASFIQEVQHTIIGYTVNITINANAAGIGLDILVPHTEIIQIGQLPAGEYSIVINGTSILDSAPQPDHQFTVTQGGGGCEGLGITSIMYEAFSDSLIEVHITNAGPGLYSYPGFILYNGNGDTVAIETVDLFVIGEVSNHRLLIHPDADLTDPSFSGTLQLWTNFYDTLVCTFPVEVELCPPACATIIPYVTNLGGALTNNTFTYTISGPDGEMATGELLLADEVQFDMDTICLPPGEYTMQVEAGSGPGAGQPWAGVLTPGNFGGPQQPVASPPVQIEFSFYEQCTEIIDGIDGARDHSGLRFRQTVDQLLIEREDGPIGTIVLMDVKGAILRSLGSSDAQVRLPIGGLGQGIYLLKINRSDALTHMHKFVIGR